MKEIKKHNVYLLFLITTIVFLIVTIGFYSRQFGHFGFSNETQDWANFGSYFGGILSPIITSFTLVFLYFQIRDSNKSTEIQIKHMQDTREIESLTNEINTLSSLIFDMMMEIRVMPKKNIIDFSVANSIGGRWLNDYDKKLVSFPDHGDFGSDILWDNVINYLKVLLELNNKNDMQKILMDYNYSYIYKNITSLLGHLIHHCYKLAEIDIASYGFIRTKLSLFKPSIKYLNEACFFDDDMVEHVNHLQSLSLCPSQDNAPNLISIFINELINNNYINEADNIDDIQLINHTQDKCESQINKYVIKCNGKYLERNLGIWRELKNIDD